MTTAPQETKTTRPAYVGSTASLQGAEVLTMKSCECAMCLHYRDNLGWVVTRVTVELELPTGERRTLTHARPTWFEGEPVEAPEESELSPLIYAGSVQEATGAPVLTQRACQCGECHERERLTGTPTGLLEAEVELADRSKALLWHARPESFVRSGK